jgi:hypothetical protein
MDNGELISSGGDWVNGNIACFLSYVESIFSKNVMKVQRTIWEEEEDQGEEQVRNKRVNNIHV